MATRTLTEHNFEETVGSDGIVLVDFWASWCGPCRLFAPVFEEASEQNPDIVFGKVDTEDQLRLGAALQIMSIPTLMVFRDGVLLYNQAGALPKAALDDLITQARALDMDEVQRALAEAS
jgi:thioredoxin 1